MAGHTSEKRWPDVSRNVNEKARLLLESLVFGKEIFDQLNELWTFAGGTDQQVADLLFQDVNAGNSPATATADQVQMVADAKAAMQVINAIHATADGNGDLDKLRRMS